MDEVEVRVLAALAEAPMPLDPTLVGERSGVEPGQAARALVRLADKGLAVEVDRGRYIPAEGYHARARSTGRRTVTWADVGLLAVLVVFGLGCGALGVWAWK